MEFFKGIFMKKIFYILNLSFLVFAITGCGLKKGSLNEVCYEKAEYEYEDAVSFSDSKAKKNSASETENFESAEENQITERKLIKTANVNIQVKNFDSLETDVNNWVKKYNGYISESSNGEFSCYYVVRIPKEHFDDSLNAVGNFGKIKNKKISARDVTEQYYDTLSRLESKKILRDKYEEYLKQAKDVKELMEVERSLNDVLYEIDGFEGRLKYLDNKISYSTVTINFELPPNVSNSGFVKPDIKEKFSDFVSAVLEFFASFFIFICYLVVFGIPVIALIALLFWLCFGKLGLLRKLYNKLKK